MANRSHAGIRSQTGPICSRGTGRRLGCPSPDREPHRPRPPLGRLSPLLLPEGGLGGSDLEVHFRRCSIGSTGP